MRRIRRRWWVSALVVVVLVGGGVTAWLLLTRDQAQAVRYLTSAAEKGTIRESIQADFTLSWATDAVNLSTSQSGVITGVYFRAGQRLRTLQKLVSASGSPVYVFVSSLPLYRNLAYGDEDANVTALQQALKAAGYDPGTVDGTFDADTQNALLDWQGDQGLTQTGTLAMSDFVWVPTGSVVETVTATKGAQAAQTTLGTARASQALQADAEIGQADINSVKVGQQAALTIDGNEGTTLTGTIVSISSEASSSSTGGSSSSAATYPVTFRLSQTPSFARPGMSGTLSIIIAQKKDVLLVPTSAVLGTGSSPFVRVMLDGKMSYRQVTTGMTTSSSTEITSGLAAGETVVTGQITSSTANSSSGSGSLLTGGSGPSGNFPGGTFRQRQSNSSSGGGQ
jgi:multidrug efflux pump subunit AcrA (membrane-fusion protein)